MTLKKYAGAIPYTEGAGVNLRFKNGVLAEIACATTPPSLAVLDAIEVDDVAAGWPSGVIAKARARRSAPTSLWVGPSVVHLGTVEPPLNALFGGGADWFEGLKTYLRLPAFLARFGLACNNSYAGYIGGYLGRPDLVANAQRRLLLDLPTDDGLRAELLAMVWGGGGDFTTTNSFVVPSATTRSAVVAQLKTLIVPGSTLVAVRVCIGENCSAPGLPGGNGAIVVYGYVPAVAGRSGLKLSFWDGPTSASSNGLADVVFSTLQGASPAFPVVGFRPALIVAEEHLVSVLAALQGARPAGPDGPWNATYGSSFAFAGNASIDALVVESVAGEATADPSYFLDGSLVGLAGQGGPRAVGVQMYSVHALGNPEFAQGLTVRGVLRLTEDVAGRTVLEIDDDLRMLTWTSDTLEDVDTAAVQAGVKNADVRPNAMGIIVRSSIGKRAVTIPAEPLAKTQLYALALEADFDLAATVVVASEDGQPAITLGEASEKAAGQSAYMFHQLYRSSPAVEKYRSYAVGLSGTSSATYAWTCVTESNVAVTDKDEAALAVSLGAHLTNGTNLPTAEAVLAIFGLGSVDSVASATKYTTVNTEFDESSLCYQAMFDVEALSEAQRCAYACMAYARPRNQLHSAVGAFLTSGRLASKKLIASKALV